MYLWFQCSKRTSSFFSVFLSIFIFSGHRFCIICTARVGRRSPLSKCYMTLSTRFYWNTATLIIYILSMAVFTLQLQIWIIVTETIWLFKAWNIYYLTHSRKSLQPLVQRAKSFHWSIVDLQCCVSFCCVARWFGYAPDACAQLLSRVRLLATPWIVAHQAQTLSMGFPRHKYWSGLPFLSPTYIPMYI